MRNRWYAGALVATCLAAAAPAHAASVYARFFNVSDTRVKVVLLHSQADPHDYSAADVHKERSIAKSAVHTFELTTKRDVCKKARQFAVHRDSPGSDELLAHGRFRFERDPDTDRSTCTIELTEQEATPLVPDIRIATEREAANQVDITIRSTR